MIRGIVFYFNVESFAVPNVIVDLYENTAEGQSTVVEVSKTDQNRSDRFL